MRALFLIAIMAVFTLGASNCSGVKMRPDTSSALAAEANDKTVIIEGCGSQPVVGYTYCRVREGSPVDQTINFIAPPIKCKNEPCVTFTIFFPNGQPSTDIAVPRGKTSVTVAWKDIVKRDTFEKGDRGFWPVLMTYKWIDMSGNEFTSQAEGEIRMRVLAANYVPLNETGNDPNLVWKWSSGKTRFGFSTAGRAYAGK